MIRGLSVALIMIAFSTGLHAYRSGVTRFTGRLMTRRHMNRLLCEVTEVNVDKTTQEMTVVLKKDDSRAKHIKDVRCFSFYKCISYRND